jgi:hypothetical protein
MDASNRPRRQTAPRRPRRRPDCSPPTSRCRAVARGPACPGPTEPSVSDGLKVTIRIISLPDPESNPLRARQLAVIVDLLQCAASEAAERMRLPGRRHRAGS